MEQIAIFYDADDFCKAYEEYCRNKLLMNKEEVVPKTKMALSEMSPNNQDSLRSIRLSLPKIQN